MSPALASAATAVLVLIGTSASGATPIYRWTDDSGATHYAQKVPDKYLARARAIADLPDPTPDQQHEARERAARDKARAAGATGPAPSPARPPTPPDPAPIAATRPARIVDNSTDCATWARLYRESLACFAPYRTARGGVKAEAFASCTEIPEPAGRCASLQR